MNRGGVRRWLAIGLMAAGGCATSAPAVVSQRQIEAFQNVVTEAEGGGVESGSALELTLREAKSDFYYAEHSPMNPTRARVFAEKAQKEAEAALALVREEKASQVQPAEEAGPDENEAGSEDVAATDVAATDVAVVTAPAVTATP